VVVSRSPKFEEGIRVFAPVAPEAVAAPNAPEAWARSIVDLLNDGALRRKISLLSAELGRETSWPAVAEQHLQLYRRLLGGKASSSARVSIR
jgi:glycosyltransferase involved in cell wall biosynthesis